MRIIELDSVGVVKLIKKRGVKNLSLNINRSGEIKVTFPYSVSYTQAETFVENKMDWIKKSIQGLNKIEEKKRVFLPAEEFVTRLHRLEMIQEERSNIRLVIKSGKIIVRYPYSVQAEHQMVQDVVREGVESAWRGEARNLLPKRVFQLAQQFGFKYKEVKINSAKGRWGSCSYDNNINLSLFVMQLPDHLIDYVLLHELVHTIHKDHSPRFWNKLEEVCTGALQLNKELKKHRIQVY